MSNFKFKVGDRVVLSEEWLNKYHPDDEKYREVFTLLPNTLGNDITVHIMFEGRYKDVFHSDGYYMESDGFAALLHEGEDILKNELLLLGENEVDSEGSIKVLKGERGVAIFCEQRIRIGCFNKDDEVLFSNKVLTHEQAVDLRDFLINHYPLEK